MCIVWESALNSGTSTCLVNLNPNPNTYSPKKGKTQEGCTSTQAIGCLGSWESTRHLSLCGIVGTGKVADSKNMMITNKYKYIGNTILNNTMLLLNNGPQ
jgi:hypothetical protein